MQINFTLIRASQFCPPHYEDCSEHSMRVISQLQWSLFYCITMLSTVWGCKVVTPDNGWYPHTVPNDIDEPRMRTSIDYTDRLMVFLSVTSSFVPSICAPASCERRMTVCEHRMRFFNNDSNAASRERCKRAFFNIDSNAASLLRLSWGFAASVIWGSYHAIIHIITLITYNYLH